MWQHKNKHFLSLSLKKKVTYLLVVIYPDKTQNPDILKMYREISYYCSDNLSLSSRCKGCIFTRQPTKKVCNVFRVHIIVCIHVSFTFMPVPISINEVSYHRFINKWFFIVHTTQHYIRYVQRQAYIYFVRSIYCIYWYSECNRVKSRCSR